MPRIALVLAAEDRPLGAEVGRENVAATPCCRASALKNRPSLRHDDQAHSTVHPHDDQETRIVSIPPSDADAAPSPADALPEGTHIDRYVILELIGSGGMGMVYAAYDPDLDRRVALKLLRTDRLIAQNVSRGQGRLRMLREARALAKLNHPNVIALYGAGTYGDDVYLAMEMANGKTLQQWLEKRPHAVQRILHVFVQAGRGLAAAHGAGLIHRDFKPSNVLVGADGRVRVVDFGLARPARAGECDETDRTPKARSSVPASRARPAVPPVDDSTLTEAGSIIGTPAYMAPEIRGGAAVDHRSDQFSFCVALYEALYGHRPFLGEGPEDVTQPRLAGAPAAQPTADRRQVSGRLHRVVMRGLSVRPEDRWPSMDVLLHELVRDPEAVRRRWLAIGAVFALGVATTIAVSAIGHDAKLCSGGQKLADAAWSPARQDNLKRHLERVAPPYAAASWPRVHAIIDRYMRDWVAMHEDACRATHVRHEQSEALLDRRMACLDSRLRAVRAFGRVLEKADAKVWEHAIQAAQSLPQVDDCGHLADMQSKMPLPTAQQAPAVERLRERMADAAALRQADKLRAAASLARPALVEARTIGYAPMVAEVQYLLGDLAAATGEFGAAVDLLMESALTAEAHHHDELVARAQIRLVRVVGYDLGRFDEGMQWERHAQAALKRLEESDDLAADLHDTVGSLHVRRGQWEAAQRHFVAGLKAREQAHGARHPSLAQHLDQLGAVASARKRFDDAIAYGRRALQLRTESLGPKHPQLVANLDQLASAEFGAGELAQAEAHWSRALEIVVANHGSDDARYQSLEAAIDRVRSIAPQAARPHNGGTTSGTDVEGSSGTEVETSP